MITGATRVAAVIGDPVRHSRSPTIFNAAFAATGLDWVYVAMPVPRGLGADAVRAIPVLGLAGLNVTMPHKTDAARACDELTGTATALGAVNTVVLRDDGSILGDSTDGAGFLASLADADLDPGGKSVVVVGAGGAARAVVAALGDRGARVTVAARRPDAAARAAALAPDGRAAGFGELDALIAASDVLVNATPVGMTDGAIPIDGRTFTPRHWVVDLVYHPERTPLLAAAGAAGARTVGGIGMLVHQAALAFERLTGLPAPLEAMREAGAGG